MQKDKLVKQMGAGNLAELVGTYGQDYVDESVGLLRVEDFIISNASVSDKISNGDTTAEDAEAAVQNSGQDAEDESADQDMSETDESIDQDASETDESDGEDFQDEPDVDENLESELGTE